jgi:integrase
MAKASGKAAAGEFAPTLVNGKVRLRRRNRRPQETLSRGTPDSPLPPRRLSNASRRKREYLTPDEVDKLLRTSGNLGRHGARDRTLILIAYRHGLRVTVELKIDALSFQMAKVTPKL